MALATDGLPRAVRVPVFADFYRAEVRGVVGLAYALTGDGTAAEDLAQEAFLAAHRQWPRIGGYGQPAAWVRRVVTNLAVSRTRRWLAEGRAMARVGVARETTSLSPLPEEAERCWAAVRSLPRRQQQVVALRYLEDRSVEEVAAILGLAVGTVKAHLARARATLAERLGEPLEEEDGT